MDSWIAKLDLADDPEAHSRLRELRKNRQRLQRMAAEAERAGEHDREIQLRKEIDRSIERDVKLSQSLGLTIEQPDEHRHSHEFNTDESIQALREARDRVDMNELEEQIERGEFSLPEAVDAIDYESADEVGDRDWEGRSR